MCPKYIDVVGSQSAQTGFDRTLQAFALISGSVGVVAARYMEGVLTGNHCLIAMAEHQSPEDLFGAAC
ncbi:hypothetical protein D3C85_1465650 [compost metagenome]